MKRKTTIIMTLSALLAFSVVYGWQQTTLAETYRQQVDSGYRKALYETMELVESMRVNLNKLQVTASSTNRRKLLAELALYAEGAQADLASLPDNMTFTEGALKFFNQVADFSVSYLDEEAASETVLSLLNTCTQLSDELMQQSQRLENGEDIFTQTGPATLPSQSDDAQPEAIVKYPSLLYDGPFSDGRQPQTLVLSGEKLNREEATEKVRGYLGSSRAQEITLTMESHILAECYEFDVHTDDGLLSLALTQKGGHVIYMLCDTEPQRRIYSVAECVDFAQRFLNQRGYGEMRVSYWQINGAMITVNFASVQDGVILYPDLIKVDVSMESGGIIGLEAGNYLSSHKERLLPEPVLTPEQAQAMIDRTLTPENIRLCLIPDDNGQEHFCYEISAVKGEVRYLVYINALTGDEEEILQIIESESGQMTV